uniref:Uncharacterized protein n=1 Tax=Zea mays TaxID=4577 RepID=A0A804NTV8_MAIZE
MRPRRDWVGERSWTSQNHLVPSAAETKVRIPLCFAGERSRDYSRAWSHGHSPTQPRHLPVCDTAAPAVGQTLSSAPWSFGLAGRATGLCLQAARQQQPPSLADDRLRRGSNSQRGRLASRRHHWEGLPDGGTVVAAVCALRPDGREEEESTFAVRSDMSG